MSDLPAPTVLSSEGPSLSPRDVDEFRALLQANGVQLDASTDWKRASQLVSLVRMLLGPLPEDPEVQRQSTLAEGPVDA